MQLSVGEQILKFSMNGACHLGRVVEVDDIGFSVELLDGTRFSAGWELLGRVIRVERSEIDLKLAA